MTSNLNTCTRLCKRPELARSRLDLVDLRAHGSASRPAGEVWTACVEATIEAREPGQPAEGLRLTLDGRAALSFGLDLLEGAAFCHHPDREAEPGRENEPLPAAEELRLLAVAVRAARFRSSGAARDLAWLGELCSRTTAGVWDLALRHEAALAGLRRAGLIEVQGFGGQTRARATDDGRTLAAMLRPPSERSGRAAEVARRLRGEADWEAEREQVEEAIDDAAGELERLAQEGPRND